MEQVVLQFRLLSIWSVNNNLNTSIDEFQNSTASISVFPNPATSTAHIRMNEQSGQELEICNPVGQMVYHSNGNLMSRSIPNPSILVYILFVADPLFKN
ncbi:MAG: hypothetical protein IPP86_02480 [Bacteroidetes bacterium]|nr:hypothetical protein [Bacteroidota bacterium]